METLLLQNLLSKIMIDSPHEPWVMVTSIILIVLTLLVVSTTLLIKILRNVIDLVNVTSLSKTKAQMSQGIRQSKYTGELLRTIKHDNAANRVTLIQLHNGTHNISGTDIYKFTFTDQEHTACESTHDWADGKPVAMLADVIYELQSKPHMSFSNISTMDDSEHTLRTLRQRYFLPFGTKSVYFFPIRDVRNTFIGVGMVEYCAKEYQMEDERLDHVGKEFIKLGALLSHAERRSWLNKIFKNSADYRGC